MSGEGPADQKVETPEAPAKNDEAKEPAQSPEKPDSEEKPPNPFSTATKNVVGNDAATQAAYRQGRQNLRIKDSGAVFTQSRVDQAVLGNVIHVHTASTTRLNPGPVRTGDLDLIRASYVAVAGYDAILDILKDRRLVLLHGSAGTGRTTTALRLLDEVTNGRISRLDPEAEIHLLTAEALENGHGYLVKLPTSRAILLTQVRLDRLNALFVDKNCWCVLIVESDFSPVPAVASYIANYSQPDIEKVLRHHLRREIPGADAVVRDGLLALMDEPEVRDALGPALSPAEMVRLAGYLAEYSRQILTKEALVIRCAAFVDQLVADWFDNVRNPSRDESGNRALRFIGYRIALAVLNRTSQHLVAEAGEKLGRHLIRTSYPLREPGRPVFASEHRSWLKASRGQIAQDNVAFGDTTVPVQLAVFNDDRMPVAVLTHVWRQHHNARTPLVRWLDELAGSPQPEVWVRAAQAAGLLCTLDFADVFHELLEGWASADDHHRRIVAAFALDHAASDPEARPAVRYVIDRWKRGDDEDEARRWTAAAALGRSLGLTSVEDTLDDLLALGTWPEGEISPIAAVASESIAQLLARGEVDLVAQRLLDWWQDRPQRSVRDVVLLATIKAANTKVSDLDDIEFFTSRAGRDRWPLLTSRSGWPLLLALQDEDPQLTAPFANVVWHTLDTARSRTAALEVVTQWIRCTEKDRSCLPALASFLWQLADTTDSKRRLQRLVAGLRSQWQQPLAANVADYLQQWLVTSRNGVGSL